MKRLSSIENRISRKISKHVQQRAKSNLLQNKIKWNGSYWYILENIPGPIIVFSLQLLVEGIVDPENKMCGMSGQITNMNKRQREGT